MRQSIRFRGGRQRPVHSLLVTGLCCLLIAATAPPAIADVAAGREAFEKGDYQRAVLEWQNAADRGDGEAQFGMGSLYEIGAGELKQDYKRADYWYRKAAEQGNTEAQYRLALIWGAGGDGFPPDLIEAYKWAALAADSKGVWGGVAADLRTQLDRVISPRERDQGKERATAWKEARRPKEEAVATLAAPPTTATPPAAAPSAPAVSSPSAAVTKSTGGCPGWPFPTLPCTEQFPALPGAQSRPAPPAASASAGNPAVAAVPAASQPVTPSRAPAAPKAPLDELNQALKQIDCASLSARATEGSAVISGTVPNIDQRAKVEQVAARLFPDGRPEISLEIVPPPLCQVLAELHGMRLGGLVTETGMTARLTNGGTRLRQGELIELAVQAPAHAVQLRIDYFSLDGQVLHLAPSSELPAAQLTAGASGVFGRYGRGRDWIAGGAPFGTELISVVATPSALSFGVPRPPVEKALDYLRDLKRALGRVNPGSGTNNALALLLVHTSAR
jgi:hypothetical protein